MLLTKEKDHFGATIFSSVVICANLQGNRSFSSLCQGNLNDLSSLKALRMQAFGPVAYKHQECNFFVPVAYKHRECKLLVM